jgi:acetylornithine deacetylase/succinyl-diaminopimelate desuccinylase-like protein
MRRRRRWSTLALLAATIVARPIRARAGSIDWARASDEAIERLQAYIRVDTSNPPGNETRAAELLRGWLAADGIEARLYDPMGDQQRQALVARLPGSSGRTIVLMSHSDVVPAVATEWSHPPFAAEVVDGKLYGRGTLDTKQIGIYQLMTLALLRRQGLAPRDELLLLIEPDEEEGSRGVKGMLERYPELFRNVRMVLNEGGAGTLGVIAPDKTIFFVQTAEKGPAWMKLTARGDAGHGSVPRPNNAVVTMTRALDKIAAYETPLRPAKAVVAMFAALAEQQPFPNSLVMRHVDSSLIQTLFRSRLTERPLINSLLRTTISLTGVHGGYKTNVIPAQVEATLDCRVTVGDSGEALKHELERVVNDPRVSIELLNNGTPNESPVDETLMAAVRDVTGRHVPGSIVAPLMTSGVTDSAAFRQRNIPAYGFDPVVITEAQLATEHGIDEHIPLDRFRAALQMYYEVVTQLTGVDASGAK